MINKLTIIILCFLALNSFGQFNPNTITGLEVWLKYDSGILYNSNGKIVRWKDQSGNGNDFFQHDSSSAPIIDSNNFLNTNLVKFGTANTSLVDSNNIIVGSIFILLNYNTNSGVFNNQPGLITQFQIDGNYRFFNGRSSGTTFFEGIFVNNMFVNGIKSNDFSPVAQYKIISGTLPSSTTFTGMRIGSDFNVASRVWEGDIAEVLIYSNPLPDSSRIKVENYLRQKYAPSVSLGNDTILSVNTLCPVTLKTQDKFVNYLWSTGSTNKSINIYNSGSYWVKTTDIFGKITSDTISISRTNVPILPSDTLFCQNSPGIQLNLGIPNGIYTCQWSYKNGNNWVNTGTTVSFGVTQTGKYAVTLQDNYGCSLADTFSVSSDNFSTLKLVSDTSFCQGNTFKINAGSNTIKSYLWNNSATTSSFAASNSGPYSLLTVNQNNCTNNTLFNVTVTGTAPSVSFTSSLPLDTGCLATPVTFYNSSTLPSSVQINNFKWDFGNGLANPTVWNPASSIYSIPGQYFVTLSVSGNNGCSNFQTKQITILNNPSANFSLPPMPYCQYNPIAFSNNSQANGVPITNYTWNFGNSAAGSINNSTSPNGIFSYSNPGAYTINLTVTNKYGCNNTIAQTLTVSGSPATNFTFNKGCLGTPITFSDSSIQSPGTVASPTGYFWTFGNGSTATIPTNTITYTATGNYPVSLTVTNNLGCSNTAIKTVSIKNAPKPGFYTGPACYQSIVQFYDTSHVEGDTITSWQWQFSSFLTSTFRNPQIVLGDSGNYAVNLTVATKSCSVQTSRPINVKVHSLPPVSFSANPSFGAPPLTVTLTSSITGISKWNWGLGNGTITSISIPPLAIIYSDSGIYNIKLTATNSFGCSDSISKSIIVSKPKIDLEVNSIGIVTTNGNQSFSVSLINKGNIPIQGITVYLKSDNGFELVENTSVTLPVGGSSLYTFTSLIPANNNKYPYFCIEAYPSNLTDGNPNNNISCKLLSGSFFAGLPFPNPSDSYIQVPITVSQAGNVTITVSDIAGKQFEPSEYSFVTNGYSTIQIQTSSLAAGVYFLYITYGDQIVVQKFVKN